MRNPKGCVAFAVLTVFGMAFGHAACLRAYGGAWEELLHSLAQRAQPSQIPLDILLSGLLFPLWFGACMAVCGYSKKLLPLWCMAALLHAAVSGVRLGAARCMLPHTDANAMVLMLLLSVLLPWPIYLAVALLPLRRHSRSCEPSYAQRSDPYPADMLKAITLLVLAESVLGTAVNLTGLYTLFH